MVLGLDSQFWSTLVAVVALVVSLQPRIMALFKGIKIRINASTDSFRFTHYLGSIGVIYFVNIVNAGGMNASISKIECAIKNDSGFQIRLPVQRFFSRQSEKNIGFPEYEIADIYPEYHIGNIYLKPGENWSELVHCFNILSDSVQWDFENGNRKIGDNMPREKDEDTVPDIMDFLDSKPKSKDGKYMLLIYVISEKNETIALSGYEFNLNYKHINKLKGIKDKYNSRPDHYFYPLDPSMVITPRLQSIPDEQAMEEYNKLIISSEGKIPKAKIKK